MIGANHIFILEHYKVHDNNSSRYFVCEVEVDLARSGGILGLVDGGLLSEVRVLRPQDLF